jgi:hypothetical protein
MCKFPEPALLKEVGDFDPLYLHLEKDAAA